MTRATAIAALALAGLAGNAGPVKVTVTAPGHNGKIGAHWNYSVTVTRKGKLVPAKLTETIVDPIGGSHPVELGRNTTVITNYRVKGVFRDFIVWPASSRGIPLVLRIQVVAGGVTKVVDYTVTPGA